VGGEQDYDAGAEAARLKPPEPKPPLAQSRLRSMSPSPSTMRRRQWGDGGEFLERYRVEEEWKQLHHTWGAGNCWGMCTRCTQS
jgi:hypothetical protein